MSETSKWNVKENQVHWIMLILKLTLSSFSNLSILICLFYNLWSICFTKMVELYFFHAYSICKFICLSLVFSVWVILFLSSLYIWIHERALICSPLIILWSQFFLSHPLLCNFSLFFEHLHPVNVNQTCTLFLTFGDENWFFSIFESSKKKLQLTFWMIWPKKLPILSLLKRSL
jgi:hypothetical protein